MAFVNKGHYLLNLHFWSAQSEQAPAVDLNSPAFANQHDYQNFDKIYKYIAINSYNYIKINTI
jgi:hypothetical protein